MAPNKRKILEAARKLAQRGAKDKALKEYQRLVKLDPKDAKLRLEIGDAHRRWGQVDEAIDTYAKVADQYTKEGFDARAVAVYKQILNLDLNRFESYLPLAELYERMGLTAEAINALQTAADGFHRQGSKREALDLLRKMATIDPTNTTSRIKVAELLRQEELHEEAIAEYDFVSEEFERHNDADSSAKVYKRILEIEPDRAETLAKLARNLLGRGSAGEAEPFAAHALEVASDEPDHYELLADIYRAQSKDAELSGVYKRLAELYRERGDEDRARDILQRYVPADELAVNGDDESDLGEGSAEAGELHQSDDLSADELLLDDELIPGERADSDEEGVPELELDELVSDPADVAVAGDTNAQSLVDHPEDVDADQLLAEASVYLRYGKRDKAVAHLERILGADSEHRLALEKLGEAYAEGGEAEKAVDLFMRAVKRAREDDDEVAVGVLRGRIASLDASAAASLDAPPPAPEPIAPVESPEDPEGEEDALELDDEVDADELIDIDESEDGEVAADAAIEIGVDEAEDTDVSAGDADVGIDTDEAEDTDVASGDAEMGFDADEIEIDIDVDVDLDDADALVEEAALPGADDTASAEESVSDAASADAVPAGPAPADAAASLVDVADTSINSASLSSSTTQQILDDLEEADFYMQQGLLDEAEEIYKRVLSVAPNHPRALARLGEVVASRGEEQGAESEEVAEAAAPVVEETAPDIGAGVAVAPPEPELVDLDDDLADLDIDDMESEAADDDDPELVAEEEVEAPTEEEVIAVADASVAAEPPAQTPVEAVPAPGDGFDLAAELSDAFEDASASASFTGGSPDDGFSSVFDAFKKGVSETLSEGDHDTRYDLGIAYKEMGLLDDAMQEFRVAMESPSRRIECLHLIGVCALEAGQPQVALEHLTELLDTPDLGHEQQLAGRLELGRAHQALGDVAQARQAFEAVENIDPNYCGVGDLLVGLGPVPAPEVAASEESVGFESFEDVISDSSEEEEPEPDPGETFQDLVDEANAEPEEEEPGEPAVPPAAPAAEQPTEPEPPPASPKKKKKKISFV